MMIKKGLLFFVFSSLSCFLTAASSSGFPTKSDSESGGNKPVTVDEIDQLIEETRRCGKIPALTLSIVSGSVTAESPLSKEFIYAKAFGKQDPKEDIDATNGTLFCIGSVTKQFTATLLMKMLNLARRQGYK
jgi:CubicO group peptidase (beta-lactamase class C family)